MRRHLTTVVLLLAVLVALIALAAVLLPASAGAVQPTRHHEQPALALAVAAPHTEAMRPSEAADEADAAFLADLFGPGVDYTPEQGEALTQVGRRIADLLTNPASVPPGADIPTREAVVASLTLPQPSLTTGFSPDEAGKIIDCALAAYGAATA